MTASLPGTRVDQALEILLASAQPVPARLFAIEDALGLILAQAVQAQESHPADDTSAMDGYAVRAVDVAKAGPENPLKLSVVEDIRAGFPPQKSLAEGQASRISTGALIPPGADAVIMRENVEMTSDGALVITTALPQGANIRYRGEHIREGETLLKPGRVLDPAAIGLCAFLGSHEVLCVPAIEVAILSTGSELVERGGRLAKGQIRDSNSVALSAAVKQLGGKVTYRARVEDTSEALDEALKRAFERSQVVITSGGISAGWHDLVRDRIEQLGGQFSFHKLRMRPGKPLAFGTCQGRNFFCLPGNPVSSMVTFEIFVKPALLKMMGQSFEPRFEQVKLSEPIDKKAGFTIFFRGLVTKDAKGRLSVALTGPQGSHMLRSMTEANVLIRTAEDTTHLPAGTLVDVLKMNSLSSDRF